MFEDYEDEIAQNDSIDLICGRIEDDEDEDDNEPDDDEFDIEDEDEEPEDDLEMTMQEFTPFARRAMREHESW